MKSNGRPPESGSSSRRPAWLQSAAAGLASAAGFGLTLGWVWFPSLFELLRADLPELLEGSLLGGGGIRLFFVALGSGFLLPILARRFRLVRPRRFWLALHAVALACLGLSSQARDVAPGLAIVLLGLAIAGPGVYWGARLLGQGPLWAGLALGLAALLAAGLAGLPALAGGLIPAQQQLAAGLGAAVCLGFVPTARPKSARVRPGGPAVSAGKSGVAAGLLGAAFFSLGLLAAARPAAQSLAQPGGVAGQLALALGMALAASALAGRKSLLAPLTAAGAGLLAALAYSGNALWLASLAEGALQGAAVVALARAWQERCPRRMMAAFPTARAGWLLLLALLLVNAGGLAGTALGLAGHPGRLLGALGLVLALSLVLAGLAARLLQAAARSRARAAAAPPKVEATLWPGLTPRENAVAELVAQGLPNPAICEQLYISDNTVRTHLKRLYQKTGAANREQLELLLWDGEAQENAVSPPATHEK